MALVHNTIPNLINGISQQPPELRIASQGSRQVNGFSSVVDGLSKRPPIILSNRITEGNYPNSWLYTINRDRHERYVVIVHQGQLRVFDLTGTEYTVNAPDGWGYIDVENPRHTLRAVTIADYTFIVNTEKTVEMRDERFDGWTEEALVHVKQGMYGTVYKVVINGSTIASYTTPDGSQSSHSSGISTSHIASKLRDGISGNSNYVCHIRGSTLRVRRSDGGPFQLRTEDGFGDQGMQSIGKAIQQFSRLPRRAWDGYTVEITGDNTSSWDNYFLRYDETGGAEGDGVWREVPKPGILRGFDWATMPHLLVREADGTFSFRKTEWSDRVVGDEERSPEPSFVGKQIKDIFFHRDRLGFLSDEAVVLSRVGEYFNFWRETGTSVLDSDPVDVTASHVKVSLLRYAVPWNEDLLLFSDQTQFMLGSDDILAPESVVVKQVTEFASDLMARPVGLGQFVYFTVNRGRFSGVREYRILDNNGRHDAEDITANVPQYIPRNVYKLAGSSNGGFLGLVSEDSPSKIYVYQYHHAGDQPVQAAWQEWVLGDREEILGMDFIETDLVVVVQRPDGVYMGWIPTEPGFTDKEAGYPTLLDWRTDSSRLTFEYDPVEQVTRITPPVENVEGLDRRAVLVTKSGIEDQLGGQVLDYERDEQGRYVIRGDVRDLDVWWGETYEFLYEFTYPILREDAVGGGQNAVNAGRLQIRTFSVQYADTGFFQVHVTPSRRQTGTYTFSGRVLGDASNIVGEINVASGHFKVPVQCRNSYANIVVTNDTFLPSRLLSAAWEGFYVSRATRI